MNENSILIRNGMVVSSQGIKLMDIRINNARIVELGSDLKATTQEQVIDATGKHVFPGLIDTHVHFREPGYAHKATWKTESAAAVAGGVTTVFDMPNTEPPTLSPELVADKLAIARSNSLCNYGSFLGVSASNLDLLQNYNLEDTNFVGLTDDGLYFSGANQLLADHPDAFIRQQATASRKKTDLRSKYTTPLFFSGRLSKIWGSDKIQPIHKNESGSLRLDQSTQRRLHRLHYHRSFSAYFSREKTTIYGLKVGRPNAATFTSNASFLGRCGLSES